MKISIKNLVNGLNLNHRKENNFTGSQTVVSFDKSKLEGFHKGFNEDLTVRFYSTQATTYCCIWGSIKGVHFNGSGKAVGYGYNRESAALYDALISAGFEVEGLSGTGEIRLAIEIICALAGLTVYTIISAHP